MSDDIVFHRDQVELSTDSEGNVWCDITMTPEQADKLASKLTQPVKLTYSMTHKVFDKPLGGHQPLTFKPTQEDTIND